LPLRDLADKAFNFAGLPLYLADTRTGRGARGTGSSAPASHILHSSGDPCAPGAFEELEAWLCEHRDLPKVVATPSMLLPRRVEVARDPSASDRSDAWDGYPASLDRLLDLLMREQIRHTVFLSGDEHHALWCEVTLHPPPQRAGQWGAVQCTSVHSSALYAPLPFANGHPADLSEEPFVTAGGTRVSLKVHHAPPGDGWARVSLSPGPGDGALEVAFVKAQGPEAP
jgi:hypothetical protein